MTSLLSINLHGKLQFACLIGGRVCNPRQQQVAYSRLAREHTQHTI